MAQVITKCRLTGHYMFMGIETSADAFAERPDPFLRKFCPFCSCEHAWYRGDSKLLPARRARVSAVQHAQAGKGY